MSKEYCELCIGQMDKSFLYVIEVDGQKIYLCDDCLSEHTETPHA